MSDEAIDKLTTALQERDLRIAQLELKVRDADILADEVAAAVVRNQIATRTPVADALEAYRLTPRTDRSDTVGVLRTRIAELETGISQVTTSNELYRKEKADLQEQLAEMQRTFDLRWKADQRAIKRWQERPDRQPGDEMIWPDHADMVVWLLEQLEQARIDRKVAWDAVLDKDKRLEHITGCSRSFEAQHAGMVKAYQERTAEADRLRVRCDALENMLVEIRKRIIGLLTQERLEVVDQCAQIVKANGGRSVQDIVSALNTLRRRP